MKIQDGGQGGLEKNVNIGFQIDKTLSFPKMYSFHFLQKKSNGKNIRNWTNRHNALLREDRLSFYYHQMVKKYYVPCI